MLAFDEELARLLAALWKLNKSVAHPTVRREMGRSLTGNVPRFDFARPAAAAQDAAELVRKGYQVLGACLSPAEVAEVRASLEDGVLFDGEALTYQTALVGRSEFKLRDRPHNVLLPRYKAESVLRCAPLVRLAADPRIVAAIEAYLGCTPTISGFQVWHTFPGQADIPAEVFHRDRDCFGFCKLFVYLSEVKEADGPHEFIQLSHGVESLQAYFQTRGLQVDLPKLFEGNVRHLSRDDLHFLLGPNVVRTTGPAGFGFLEDTFGLHRGTRPTASPRLIFSVTYTSLPLRFANENDRAYEMGRQVSFAEAGLAGNGLERYLYRFFLA